MSAYVVDKAHIDALIDGGLRFRVSGYGQGRTLSWYLPGTDNNPMRRQLTRETADAVGQMLTDANVRSVYARYPDCDPARGGNADRTPGPNAHYWGVPYRHQTRPPFSPTELLMALRGFEYQACEADDWPQSEAHVFCRALQTWLIQALPDYDDGPWAITDETRPLAETRSQERFGAVTA